MRPIELLSLFLMFSYHQTGTIDIPGAGGFDYLLADSGNRRLYVSHATVVEVVDLDSDKVIGQIPNTNGVHGIAVARDLGRGFISAGRDNQVVIFDLKTLATIGTVKTGTNPDGIIYEPQTQRVFTFNGRSKDATAINAKDGAVLKTIDMGGKPEFPTTNGKGEVFVNIEDKNEIIHLDAKTLEVKAHWSIAPAESPSGMAIDTASRRLFSVCASKVMVVTNYETGKVVATVPIGEGPDAAAFDPGTHTVFASNGQSGTLTVVKELGHDQYAPTTVETKKSARTMALDLKTHKIYLPTVEYGPPPAATAENPRPWPSIVAGSFRLMVMSR
jgi:DNA-binding beta-propeller fold protein YncE